MSDDQDMHDADLDLLAALSEGTLTPDDVGEERLERILRDGGTNVLGQALAERHTAERSEESEPVIGFIGRSLKAPLALAAAFVILVGGSIAYFAIQQRGGSGLVAMNGSPLNWTKPLEGPSGFLDQPAMKGAASAFDRFLTPDDGTVDLVEPAILDLDGDDFTDAIAFGFTKSSEENESPWLIAVFVGSDSAVVRSASDWGFTELATAGFEIALCSRLDGSHAALRVETDDEPGVVAVDEDGDGECDVAWIQGHSQPCAGSLLEHLNVSNPLRERLIEAYRTTIQKQTIPALDVESN